MHPSVGDVRSEVWCIIDDTLMYVKDPISISSFRKGEGACTVAMAKLVRAKVILFPLSVAVNIENVDRVWIWLLCEF
jgi:hypothetical protein